MPAIALTTHNATGSPAAIAFGQPLAAICLPQQVRAAVQFGHCQAASSRPGALAFGFQPPGQRYSIISPLTLLLFSAIPARRFSARRYSCSSTWFPLVYFPCRAVASIPRSATYSLRYSARASLRFCSGSAFTFASIVHWPSLPLPLYSGRRCHRRYATPLPLINANRCQFII